MVKLALENKFVTVDGRKVRYVEGGDGPPLVILHSLAVHGSLNQWRPYFDDIGAVRHFYAIDMVGWGLSDMPADNYSFPMWFETLKGFVDAVGLEKTDILAMSLGSWISALFAHKYPERVDRLALLESPGLNPALAAQNTTGFKLPGIEVLRNAYGDDAELTYEEMNQPGREEAYGNLLKYVGDPAVREEWSLRPRLPDMKMPIFLSNLDNNRAIPAKYTYEAFTLAENARLYIHPGGPEFGNNYTGLPAALQFLTAKEVPPAK
jgi:pimeloyl-ACP methyl ester carboxylesterase